MSAVHLWPEPTRLAAVVVATAILGGLASVSNAAPSTAYLWNVRRGCQVDTQLEEATLSRVRGVGRQIILLNVPASAETRSCSGKRCAELVRHTAACGQLGGPLIGAELDEVQGPGGIVNRIRAWRYDLADDASPSLMQEFLTCPAERCGHQELQEAVAKVMNRLLDRTPGTAAGSAPQLAFPSAECVRAAEGFAGSPLPAYCEQPIATACDVPELIAAEPSGRVALQGSVDRKRPRATPQRWEWLPISGAVVGLASSIGLGIANESVRPGGERYVLTPAFWTSSALTVVLAASSVAVVGDRYRREVGSAKEVPTAEICPFLLEARRGGKEP